MHSFKIAAAAAVLAIAAAGSALAQGPAAYSGRATLATPASTPVTATISGVSWSCNGADCVGAADRYATLDSVMKECRKVAAAVGPLAGFSTRGRNFSAGNLAICNKGASVQTATR